MMRLTQDWTLPGSGSNQFRTGSALSIGDLNLNQNLHDRGRTEPELNPNPEFSSPGSGSNLGSELNFGNPSGWTCGWVDVWVGGHAGGHGVWCVSRQRKEIIKVVVLTSKPRQRATSSH